MILRNEDIGSAVLAVPEGHTHLRLAITTKDGGTIVLQEATVAAIARAYTAVKTHPVTKAVKLVSVAKPEGLKKGYAEHQLVEVEEYETKIIEEITSIL